MLDADCQLRPDAISACLTVADKEDVSLVVGRRLLVRLDGTPLGISDDPFPWHVDTSCYFFLRPAFRALLSWALIPPPFHVLDDRVVRRAVEVQGLRVARTEQITVVYPTRWAGHYVRAGEPPPAAAKHFQPAVAAAWAEWQALDDDARNAYCAALGFEIPVDPPRAGAAEIGKHR